MSTPITTATTRFIGRASDLERIDAAFGAGAHLITVWAAGGMGKTRLTVEFGQQHREQGGDLVFCDLTEARDDSDVVAAMARALGTSLSSGDLTDATHQLGRTMASRSRLLIILDNFEQVVETAPRLVSVWLEVAPRARFLATSRARLNIRG